MSGQGRGEVQAARWLWPLTLSPGPPGLCCCPTLKLYACSSLDGTIRIWTAENRLLRWAGGGRGLGACLCCCLRVLFQGAGPDCRSEQPSRLLQLNGAPQALSFCSNSGDLVLALGSCLCLVAHRLYLPTSYLIKVRTEHR